MTPPPYEELTVRPSPEGWGVVYLDQSMVGWRVLVVPVRQGELNEECEE